MAESEVPFRKQIDHQVPAWVKGCPEFFMTLCCQERGVNILCSGQNPKLILDSVRHYQREGKWWPEIFLLMPDHLHAILSVPQDRDLSKTIGYWKRYITLLTGVGWQKGFFEHRLRSSQSADEKYLYILENPVRGGLVSEADVWPHRLFGRC